MPNAWSMSRTLVTALAVSGVNIVGATILLFLADLGRASWWHIFNHLAGCGDKPRAAGHHEWRGACPVLLPLSRSAWGYYGACYSIWCQKQRHIARS